MKLPYRCLSPECIKAGKTPEIVYIEEGSELACPRCSSDRENHIVRLSIVHMLVPSKPGDVVAVKGQDLDYSFGCDRAKERAAAGNPPKYYSGSYEAITCEYCLENHKPKESVLIDE